MHGQSKANHDSKITKRFIGWARHIQEGLKREEAPPASTNFVFTQFARKLCSIHRKQTLSDETGETYSCDNHPYLYVAVRLAYQIHFPLKSYVSMLFREIFLCEGSLQSIFSMFYDLFSRAQISMHTFTLYPKLECIDNAAFEYYISSISPLSKDVRESDENPYTPANILNKRYIVGGQLTIPLQAATVFGDADLILLLLRHGADPLVCKEDAVYIPQKTPVGFTVDTLNISTMMKVSSLGRFYRVDDMSRYVLESTAKALVLLEYFSRAAFALDIRVSSQTVDTTGKQADDTPKAVHFEVQPPVVEVIGLASYRQAPSLRHACRYAIRDALSRAGREAIPQGVRLLQLPSVLKDYLDLQC